MNKPPVVVIVGPTASGKSQLGVEIAQAFNGEVISADSRQVYKGLNIATGKITLEEMQDIPHHLLDIAEPHQRFNVMDFKERAYQALANITSRGRLPIIVGGTGYYIQAVVDNLTYPAVNDDVAGQINEIPKDKLLTMAKSILNKEEKEGIDMSNVARVRRAVILKQSFGYIPHTQKNQPHYEFIQIGLQVPHTQLKEKIRQRTIERLERGMIEEVTHLHKDGLSLSRMRELGLEYRILADYLEGNVEYEELEQLISTADWQYARKQMTWFKRDKRILWLNPEQHDEIFKIVSDFVTVDTN